MDAVCIGEILIDFLPGSEPGSYLQYAGGAPANVAVAMARNGLDIGFLGKVGMDSMGDFLIGFLKREGIAPMCEMRTDQAVTTMVFVSLQEDGERSFTFARKPGADMFLNPSDIDSDLLCGVTLLNAGSVSLSAESARSATILAMRRAHEMGKLVSFDLNYRAMIWNYDSTEAERVVRSVLPYVDLLKLSDEEQGLLAIKDDVRPLLEAYDIHAVVVTYGDRGSRCTMRGCEDIHMPAVKTQAIDTTGSGDAFWGNVLSSLLRKGICSVRDIDSIAMTEALRIGNLAGSLCTRVKGAIPGIPFKVDLDQHFEKTQSAYKSL